MSETAAASFEATKGRKRKDIIRPLPQFKQKEKSNN